MGLLDRFKKDMPKASVASTKPREVKAVKEKAPADATPKQEKKKIVLPDGLVGVIIKPLVTEKAAHLAHLGQYVFAVHHQTTRIQVRAAVKALYGVIPTKVNIVRARGKVVRFGRTFGRRSDWKKAVVTLPKGKTIDIYEGV